MRTHHIAALVLCSTFASCADNAGTDSPDDVASAQVTTVAGWDVFGGQIGDGDTTDVAQLIANATENDGQRVMVHGTVDTVCQVKGCWMTLSSGDESMRVKFKDYGFFVPLDCEGREVVLEGLFEVKELTVDEARHYLEDAGKPEEAAALTEPVMEYSFLADGVRMKQAD